MECPICIEKITPSKKVECSLCNYVACSKCIQTYLLNSPDDPHCLNCKRIWDRETLLKHLPKTFINGDFKRHRENMLLERETAMMTSTQPYVEQEIQRRKNVEVLMKLQNEKNILKRNLFGACQNKFLIEMIFSVFNKESWISVHSFAYQKTLNAISVL